VSPVPSPEDGNISSFKNVVFFRILSDGKSPVVPNVIYNHQNPLESIICVGFELLTTVVIISQKIELTIFLLPTIQYLMSFGVSAFCSDWFTMDEML
jgi:hypothetical protein